MRSTKVLKRLRAELERSYGTRRSSLKRLHSNGNTAEYLVFRSAEVAVDVMCWDTGQLSIEGVDLKTGETLVECRYGPDEPADAAPDPDQMLAEKINELLGALHSSNRRIRPQLSTDP